MHPSPWSPDTRYATTHVTVEPQWDGTLAIGKDYQKGEGHEYRALKVFKVHPDTGQISLHLFDTAGSFPEQPAIGAWKDNVLTLLQSTRAGVIRFIYRFDGHDRYHFSMAIVSEDIGAIPVIDGDYVREAE